MPIIFFGGYSVRSGRCFFISLRSPLPYPLPHPRLLSTPSMLAFDSIHAWMSHRSSLGAHVHMYARTIIIHRILQKCTERSAPNCKGLPRWAKKSFVPVALLSKAKVL